MPRKAKAEAPVAERKTRFGGTTSAAKMSESGRRERFLEELARTGNVSAAVRESGLSRTHAYRLRDNDNEFREGWNEAVEEAVDELEKEARRRAVEGVDRPVFYQGNECGRIREYSDVLLIFLLKGARPEKYRHEAYMGANATQSAADVARQIHEAAQAMQSSVPAPPPQEVPPA